MDEITYWDLEEKNVNERKREKKQGKGTRFGLIAMQV